ncbi:MAG TPA: ATP-binding protein [bacterium]|nr:ATP-binding protein [bacterium]HPN30731.1 ATP-binding protein [bacterium]
MDILIKNNFYSSFTSIGFIIGKLKEDLAKLNCDPEKINDVCLIVDEMISNVIKYAYNRDKTKQFFFESYIEKDSLFIIIEDSGTEFNMIEYNKMPDYNVEVEDLPIGGLGIRFVKEVATNINYEYTSGSKNRLIIEKKIL